MSTEPVRLVDILNDSVVPELKQAAEIWDAMTPDERAAQQAAWDEEHRLQREDELSKWRTWDANQIPTRFLDSSLSDFDPAVIDIVGPWIEAVCEDHKHNGLLIAGPTGVGKTRLMWAIYDELASRSGPRMEVVKLVRLLSSLRPGGDSSDDAVTKLCQVPILAIDDIGAHKPSEWVNERLYEIVDTRYDNTKPIIATTNRKNLDAVLDDRLTSRLNECCELVVLTGSDRRREAL